MLRIPTAKVIIKNCTNNSGLRIASPLSIAMPICLPHFSINLFLSNSLNDFKELKLITRPNDRTKDVAYWTSLLQRYSIVVYCDVFNLFKFCLKHIQAI